MKVSLHVKLLICYVEIVAGLILLGLALVPVFSLLSMRMVIIGSLAGTSIVAGFATGFLMTDGIKDLLKFKKMEKAGGDEE